MTHTAEKEEYIYQVYKIKFVVTPVYKEDGEPLRDILLSSCWPSWSQHRCFRGILNMAGRQRCHISRIKPLA